MLIGGLQKLSLVDYPGKLSAVIFTQGCNFRCGYCHNPELVIPACFEQSMPMSEIEDFIKKRAGKLDGIVITGGEPTLHMDLTSLITKIKELGYLVKLDSNGSNPVMLEYLLSNNLIDYIAMDIKGPIEKYSEIAEKTVKERAILTSIDLIMKSGIDYELRTTVVKDQLVLSDFEKIGQMIKGAKRYAIQKFVPSATNNPEFLNKTAYSDNQMEKIRDIMLQYVDICVIH